MGSVRWISGLGDDVVAFRNGPISVIANTGSAPVELPVGEIILASAPISGFQLPGDATVWMVAAD